MNAGPSELAVLQQARTWAVAGEPVALATVTRAWGSAPRRVGSVMAVRGDGAFCGSVSGGCVERAVIEAAVSASAQGMTLPLHFNVSQAAAWEVGLACGGEIDVWVEPLSSLRLALLAELVELMQQRRPVAWVRRLGDVGELTPPDPLWGFTQGGGWMGGSAADPTFTQGFLPSPQLYIVGAVHIAQLLAPMAALAGIDACVVDHRRGFATQTRFPDTPLVVERPWRALREARLDEHSAVVTLTHHPDIDDPALVEALRSPAFYVAALGSRKTQAQRLQRLADFGVDEGGLARLHGPAGLDLGATSPGEIAVAVLAQLVAALRGGSVLTA